MENFLDQNCRVSVEWGVVEFACVWGDPDRNTRKSGWLCEECRAVHSAISCVTMKCYPQQMRDVSWNSSMNIVTG